MAGQVHIYPSTVSFAILFFNIGLLDLGSVLGAFVFYFPGLAIDYHDAFCIKNISKQKETVNFCFPE